MNLDPLHNAAAGLTSVLASMQQAAPDIIEIRPDSGVDDGAGLLMPMLAGIAAAMTVAFALRIYFQTGYRSYRDMIRHGLTAALGLALLAFIVYDMRNVALAHLARTSGRPAAEFELRWQQTAERAKALAAEMARPSPDAHQG
jgi:hypothetical protein